LIPDLFLGDKMPEPKPDDFDIIGWIKNGTDGKSPHTPATIDPVIVDAINALKERGITKIGAVGYCFGAKVSISLPKYCIQC
jgi:dienelactone hydrolase